MSSFNKVQPNNVSLDSVCLTDLVHQATNQSGATPAAQHPLANLPKMTDLPSTSIAAAPASQNLSANASLGRELPTASIAAPPDQTVLQTAPVAPESQLSAYVQAITNAQATITPQATPIALQAKATAPVMPELEVEAAAPIMPEPEVEAAAPIMPEPEVEAAAPIMPEPEVEAAAPIMPELKVEAATPIMPELEVEAAAPIMPEPEVEAAAPIMPELKVEAATPIMPELEVEAAAPNMPEPEVKQQPESSLEDLVPLDLTWPGTSSAEEMLTGASNEPTNDVVVKDTERTSVEATIAPGATMAVAAVSLSQLENATATPEEGIENVAAETVLETEAEITESTAPKDVLSMVVEDYEDSPNTMDEGADEALRLLTDTMSGSNQPQERAVIGDIILRLIGRLSRPALQHLAERLSLSDAPPPLVLSRLLNQRADEIVIPLLDRSSAITEHDLLKLVSRNDECRNKLIARRRDLSPEVCETLAHNGSRHVLLELTRNTSAKISFSSFLHLAKLAKDAPELLAPLINREDTPAPIALELFWLLPSEMRRFVLKRFLTDSTTIDSILKIAIAVEVTDSKSNHTAMGKSERADIAEFITMIEQGRVKAAAQMLSRLVTVNEDNAMRIINDPLGEPLAVVCKALGLSRSDFYNTVQRWHASPNRLWQEERDVEELQIMFDMLSFNKARTLLIYWNWGAQKIGPYA